MKFWDASAVVPLLLDQTATQRATALRLDDPAMAVWWGTTIECTSAVARLLRAGSIDRSCVADALSRLREFEREWIEIEPTSTVKDDACRLLRLHPLRAADALQLAAALRLAQEMQERPDVVCFDARLAEAARSEQLRVITAEGS
jgi:predicted nucleic acid-binding protein